MKQINLDDYDPKYSTWKGKYERIHLDGWTRKGPGISAGSLLDWRALESRYNELHQKSNKLSTEFWAEMKRLAPRASRKKEAWFCSEDDTIIRYGGEGYTISRGSTEVEHLLSRSIDMTSQGKFSNFVLYPKDIASHVNQLRLKSEKYYRAAALFVGAFRRAVVDRIKVYLDEKRMSYSEQWGPMFRPGIVMLNVSGRTYPIYVTNRGEIQWLEGNEADFVEAS